jgi:hypothetical protein
MTWSGEARLMLQWAEWLRKCPDPCSDQSSDAQISTDDQISVCGCVCVCVCVGVGVGVGVGAGVGAGVGVGVLCV